LWEAWKGKSGGSSVGAVEEERACGFASIAGSGCVEVLVGELTLKAKLDTGADVCVISPTAVEKLKAMGSVREKKFETSKVLRAFSGAKMDVEREVCLDLCVPTECGDLHVRDVNCWVSKQPMPTTLGDLLLSRGVMNLLGYNEDAFLLAARQRQCEYIMGAVELDAETGEIGLDEDLKFTPEFDLSRDAEKDEVASILEVKCEEARKEGASEELVTELRKLLHQ
jgi:hypothetical protein